MCIRDRWYIVIGFLVTFVIGLLVSGCMKAFGRDIVQLDPDLFSPPVAHMLRNRRRRSNLVSDLQFIFVNMHLSALSLTCYKTLFSITENIQLKSIVVLKPL